MFMLVAWVMGIGIGLIFTFLFWHLQVAQVYLSKRLREKTESDRKKILNPETVRIFRNKRFFESDFLDSSRFRTDTKEDTAMDLNFPKIRIQIRQKRPDPVGSATLVCSSNSFFFPGAFFYITRF